MIEDQLVYCLDEFVVGNLTVSLTYREVPSRYPLLSACPRIRSAIRSDMPDLAQFARKVCLMSWKFKAWIESPVYPSHCQLDAVFRDRTRCLMGRKLASDSE